MVKVVNKEWGREEWLVNNEKYCLKKLYVNEGKMCSYHCHKNKDETFFINKGHIILRLGEEFRKLREGDAIRIEPNTYHSFGGLEDTVILEVSTHHEDSDSYRMKGQLSGDIPKKIMEKYKNGKGK